MQRALWETHSHSSNKPRYAYIFYRWPYVLARANSNFSDPIFFVVYNAEGGFAAGGGWIYPDAESTVPGGKAHFGFVTNHKQGTAAGNLEFQYQEAEITLKNTDITWLVISTNKAMFHGTATVNGDGIYTFRVEVKDKAEPGVSADYFSIKIWEGTDTEGNPIHKAKNTLVGGNIIVHTK